jgi:N-methylhydantoinase A
MTWRIGVDIGGTFTDVVVADEATGSLDVVKVPTTPRDFARGVLDALDTATRRHGVVPSQVSLLAHATTVVTNALLEEKGARIALLTTQGMRDVLELRRSARASLYDLFQDGPHVIVPRHLRLEIRERLDAQGQVVTALRMDDVERAVDFLRRHEVQAVAVCFLYSFLNDAHERAVGARLRAALPGVPVFLSSEVLPEIREFERTSTTAVCAYVGPILASYLDRLESAVKSQGFPSPYVMGSSGGVFTVAEGLTMPAMAVESGPPPASSPRSSSGDGSGCRTSSRSTWAAPPPRRASSSTARSARRRNTKWAAVPVRAAGCTAPAIPSACR